MIRRTGILFILFLITGITLVTAGNRVADTAVITQPAGVSAPKDSFSRPATPSFVLQAFKNRQAFVSYLLENNALLKATDSPRQQLMKPRSGNETERGDKTGLFYLVLGVCFLLAVIRIGFKKYFSDLFQAFFSPTLSQRQLKDQLYQTPFPAFALNVFFAVSAGVYLYLVLLKTRYLSIEEPLYLVTFFILLFIIIYLVKYLILRICGWLFGFYELMDNYIFTLFLINKILGIVLLPFILILAFSPAVMAGVFFNISVILIALLFFYRYIRVFPMVKSQTGFSKFHFFLYLCGLEIAPVLIIGKLTLIWLNGA